MGLGGRLSLKGFFFFFFLSVLVVQETFFEKKLSFFGDSLVTTFLRGKMSSRISHTSKYEYQNIYPLGCLVLDGES